MSPTDPLASELPVLDVAIVGAGVSGLYSGWRLLTAPDTPPARVAVFEASGRVGGRLLSVTPPAAPDARVELGGMRYTSSQERVQALVRHLGLPVEPFVVGQPGNLAYVRGRRLRTRDLVDPSLIPYALAPDERGHLADGFTVLAAERFLCEVLQQPHVDLKAVDWDRVAREGRYQGQRLQDVTMRYVFNRSVSHEAFQFAEDTSGYDSIFFTWNAVDGFPWNLEDYGAAVSYWRLTQGYESLPRTLAARFQQAGGELRLGHRLSRFDACTLPDGSRGVRLEMEAGGEMHEVLARALVLAMPRRSLELIEASGAVLGPQQTGVRRLIESVQPIPLFKLALCYRQRWWEPLGITRGQSVTDLPIRQCYYWPMDWPTDRPADASADSPGGADIQAGVILIYNDGADLDYWAGLRGHPDRFANQPDADSRLPCGDDEWARHPAPELMVREAHRQLMIMHGLPEDSVPLPYSAAYRDWGDDPYGGGANFWPQYVDSRDVAERIVQPVPSQPVYICGEAYSHAQGWVEGALATAEDMLQRHLGLAPPPF